MGLGLGVGLDHDWNLGIFKNSIHSLLRCDSDPFISHYFSTLDMMTYIGGSIDYVIKECKKSSFIQRLWLTTVVLVVTEGGDEFFEKKLIVASLVFLLNNFMEASLWNATWR